MKRAFLSMLLFAAVQGYAQKVEDEDIKFNYMRMPTESLGKGITNYQSAVTLTYAGDNASKKADAQAKYEQDVKDYPQKVKDADAKYDADMKEWRREDSNAEVDYQRELAEWNKKSAFNKMASKSMNNEGKPVKRNVSKPYRTVPPEPQKPNMSPDEGQKDYDVDQLASTYIILQGFKKAPENAVIVTVSVGAFDCIKPSLKTETRQMMSSSNGHSSNYNTNYYSWETSYKQPMSVKVEAPGKGVVFNQGIEKFNTYTVVKTQATDDYNASHNMDVNAYVKSLQDKTLSDNLKYINEMVNEKYGFMQLQRKTVLYHIKAKGDNNYDDYEKAYQDAVSAYNMMATDPAGAKAKLKASIDTWEKALTEYKPGDKKARVNDDVCLVTHLNLAEAYMWVDDYAKADDHLVKTSSLDPSHRQKKWMEELRTLSADQKQRFEANK